MMGRWMVQDICLGLSQNKFEKDTKFRNKFLNNRPSHEIWGSKGGVSTMDPISTAIGIDILNKVSGNAIDASIAIASTLAVTSPNWSGLAGDSAWLYYNKKQTKHLTLMVILFVQIKLITIN